MTKSAPGTAALSTLMSEYLSVARSGDPEACAERLAGRTQQVQGLKSVGEFAGLSVVIDEPVSFGGSGSAPNPAEVALAALGASLEVTFRCYAAHLGVSLDRVGVELQGDMDIRGFFDTDPTVPAGFTRVSARVVIESSASSEDLARVEAAVRACCPMLDLFTRPTSVDLSFATRTCVPEN